MDRYDQAIKKGLLAEAAHHREIARLLNGMARRSNDLVERLKYRFAARERSSLARAAQHKARGMR